MFRDYRLDGMTVTIRLARPEDGDTVATIRVESWRATYGGIVPAGYLETMDADRDQWCAVAAGKREGVELLVCEVDGSVVGFACYGPARPPAFDFTGELYATYFRPSAVGKGFGTATMEMALRGIARLGYRDAILWVLEGNLRARRFYERISGTVVPGSRRSFVIDGQTIWEVAYGFRLAPAVK
jgi:L-amino acid N-acyltransferase YncA